MPAHRLSGTVSWILVQALWPLVHLGLRGPALGFSLPQTTTGCRLTSDRALPLGSPCSGNSLCGGHTSSSSGAWSLWYGDRSLSGDGERLLEAEPWAKGAGLGRPRDGDVLTSSRDGAGSGGSCKASSYVGGGLRLSGLCAGRG